MEVERNETEVKIRIEENQIEEVLTKLAVLGFRQKAARAKEENLLLDDSNNNLKVEGVALRLRQYGQKQVLTYKGPKVEDANLKIREEIETEISDFDSMKAIFERLGLTPRFQYSKYRQKHALVKSGREIEFCIDETPIGCFVEIEGSREDIQTVAESLGWGTDRYINRNYVDLYKEQGYGEI